jgi:hypothetical protein
MPLWLKVVVQIIFFAIIFLVVYNQLKIHVLSKLHPNKWVILGLSIVSFFVPTGIAAYFKYNINGTVWQYVQSAVFIVLFLWFIDLKSGAIYKVHNKGTTKKSNDVVIRPKAKPNRVNKNEKK